MLRSHRDYRLSSSLWGLVLAAGDGRRLQGFIRKIRGENLPKQYVNFIGRRSMLEHTFDRAERLIPPRQILTVVSKQHLRFAAVRDQLARRAPETVIVQPQNRETGPGILLPLMHLYKRCPDAIVALFPSDHFILEEDRFMDHVGLAAQAVAHDPSRIVLLAVEAQEPEVDYGYILPRVEDGGLNLWGLRSVVRFVEKPDSGMARKLVKAGALWNSMIIAFKVGNLLDLMQRFCAPMYLSFTRLFDAIGTPHESQTVEEIYHTLEPMNFSTGFLEKIVAEKPAAISVLPVLHVSWSDWGSPQRLLKAGELMAPTAQYAAARRRGTPQPGDTRIGPSGHEMFSWQRQPA